MIDDNAHHKSVVEYVFELRSTRYSTKTRSNSVFDEEDLLVGWYC